MDVAAASAGAGGEPRRRVVVPTGGKALGFVRRPHRSRGRPFGGPRGTQRAEAAPGFRPPRLPDKGARFDSSRPLALHCRSLVGSGRPVERELDSQPGNRCSAARGLRWPAQALDTPACGAPCRSRVCSTFTLVAEVGARFSIRRSRSAMEGALDRGRPAPFMWSGGKRSARGVRRESVFAERRSKRPARLGNPDDLKRVEAP
jgi:hypothetical protein